MKSRDVKLFIAQHGTEAGIIKVLEAICDDLAQYKKDLTEMSVTQLHAIKMIEQVVDGSTRIRQEVEKVQRRIGTHDEDTGSTH